MIKPKSIYNSILILGVLTLFLFVHSHQATADLNSELNAEDAFDKKAYYLLVKKEYTELEQVYKSYLDSYTSGKITAEELSIKFTIFTRAQGLESRFDEWVNAYPKSYSARLARGIYRVTNAWELRGSKFANETTDDQFRRFKDQLKNAQSDIEKSLKLFPLPIESYRFLIRISKGLSLGNERKLLDAALKIDPKAFYPRFEYLNSITPKWGGSYSLMTKFIDESKNSRMNTTLMKRLEGDYYYYLAEQTYYDKDYKSASEYYLRSYRFNNKPSSLYESGKAAADGGFKDLAFSRFDELAKSFPKYPYGFTQRGYLYESHFKDYDKAIKDYLVASKLGNSWAQNRVGWYYMTGTHVPTDLKKAKEYFSRAAKQDNKTAIENLNILKNLKKDAKTFK